MRDLVTLQIQSCAQEAPPPRLLGSLTDLMGKLRPEDKKSSPGSILCQRKGQHLNRGPSLPGPCPSSHSGCRMALPPPSGMGWGWEVKKGRWADKSEHVGKVCGGGGDAWCTPGHTVGLCPTFTAAPTLTSGSLGRGVQNLGVIPVTSEAVRFGAQSGQRAERLTPSSRKTRPQLAMTADLNGTQKRGSVRCCAYGAAWKVLGRRRRRLVLGRQHPQALGFTVNLVHLWPMQGCSPKGSQRRRACRGPRGLCGSCASTPARPQPPPQTQPAWRVPETPPSAGQLCQ